MKMNGNSIKENRARMKALLQLGEQRARAAGHIGSIFTNDWLSEDEHNELIASIRALPQTMTPKLPRMTE